MSTHVGETPPLSSSYAGLQNPQCWLNEVLIHGYSHTGNITSVESGEACRAWVVAVGTVHLVSVSLASVGMQVQFSEPTCKRKRVDVVWHVCNPSMRETTNSRSARDTLSKKKGEQLLRNDAQS